MLAPTLTTRRQRAAKRLQGLRYGDPPWARTTTLLVIGGVDLAFGTSRLATSNENVPAFAYAAAAMPLTCYWLTFTAAGLAIIGSLFRRSIARRVALASIALWVGWAYAVARTVPSPQVTIASVITTLSIAAVHYLLMLYAPRRHDHLRAG